MREKGSIGKRTSAWHFRLLLAMFLTGIMLAGWACTGAEGTDGNWPPTGKTEAGSGENSVFFVYNHVGAELGEYLDIWHEGQRESVTAAAVKLIDGDASYADAFSIKELSDGTMLQWETRPEGIALYYHPETVSQTGEGTFLLNMESEHYWRSLTLHVKFVNFDDIKVQQKQDTITCLVGDKIGGWDLGPQLFTFEAGLSNYHVGTRLVDVNEAGYRIENGELIASKEGDFTVPVTLQLGATTVEVPGYRFTLHAVSPETAEAEWKASWPPAGKEEGCLNAQNLAGIYVSHYAGLEGVSSVGCFRFVGISPGMEYDYGNDEGAVTTHLAFVSGDERLKNVFRASDNYFVGDGLENLDADGAQATFRIDAESEHYYGSAEFTVTTVNFESVTAELTKDMIPTTEKDLYVYADILQGDTLRIAPEMDCFASLGNEAGPYTDNMETDQYAITEWGGRLTFKQPGQYPLYLYLSLGRNNVTVRKPVTIDAKVIMGEASEEVAGEGDASLDQDLELRLNQEDSEYTIYAGGKNNHIGFWDIVDYDTLKAAWGGEPGWSIQPAEGSEDVLRWSNASLDGKSIWAFGTGDQPAVAGDYESVLTCTWHGQTASVNIKVHVIKSPSGVLQGITGIEEAYTMKVGETLELDPQTDPVGWAPPEGTFELGLWYIHCNTDDGHTWNAPGEPYFHILFTTGKVGPVKLTALKSGEYEIGLEARAANFYAAPEFKITVQNEDGTVPTTAAEMQDAPESVLAGRKKEEAKQAAEQSAPGSADDVKLGETDSAIFQYDEVYGGITIKKIIPLKEELVIPAVIDGQNVVSISYSALDPYAKAGGSITSLVMEEGVKRIEAFAFYGQERLKSIWLPDSVESIRSSAFERCTALTEIRLPSSIQANRIENGAFRMIGAESLFLPDGTDLMKRSLEQFQRGDVYTICISTYAEPFEYLTVDGAVYIIYYLGYGEEAVSVPREINGKPVRVIGRKAFEDNTYIRKIELPEGLAEIGEKAFYGCTALEEVTIPSTVTVIGSKAFAKVGVESIALPEGITEAADDWFTGPERTDSTGKWKYLILPNGTAELSEYEYTETMEFPSQVDGYTVTAIQASDKGGSPSNVKKIILPDTLKVIGAEAFRYAKLSEVALPEGLQRIGDRAFYTVELKRLTLPESLVFIGKEAFYGHKIDELVFPAGLKSIGNAAFDAEGKYPSKVTFKGFATEIGSGVFGYTFTDPRDRDDPATWRDYYTKQYRGKTETITLTCYPGSTADTLYQNNVKKKYLEWGEENIRTAPAEKVLQAGLYGEDELIFEIIVPEGVEEIAEGAFKGMKTLTKVSLPATLKTIGAGAFEDCTALKEITLPERVSVIPSNAFKGCTSLSKVTVGKEGLLRIGSSAFRNCKALTELKMGKRLTEIGEFAFAGTGLKKAAVPDTVTKIGNNAFAASQITSLTLPKGLTVIPDGLCYNAGSLKTVTLPKGITAIGKYAFFNCDLSKLTLPEGLVSIGERAFLMEEEGVDHHYYWSQGKKPFAKLKSLKLPASLETIGNEAFACQDALTGISFAKGSKLREIGEGAFRKCINLKEVKLPDSLESISGYAFMNCVGLKKADLGSGVISIGDSAFAKDSNMTDMTVPDTLTEIGKNLLDGHGDKLTVTCGAGSAMESWLQINAPEITIKHPKQK